MSFTLLHSQITSLWMCSSNSISCIVLSMAPCIIIYCYTSFFIVADISDAFNITGKMILLKRWTHRFLSSFALSTSFIIILSSTDFLIHVSVHMCQVNHNCIKYIINLFYHLFLYMNIKNFVRSFQCSKEVQATHSVWGDVTLTVSVLVSLY